MNIQKVLIKQLEDRYKTATLMLVLRAKLYAFHQSNKDCMFNCQGWLIIRKMHETGYQYISIINPTDFEPLFEMEHYSNFAQYSKSSTSQLFFFFVVPSETGPIKLGLCFQDRQSIEQFKKVIKEIQYKGINQGDDQQQDIDLLNRPWVNQLLKKKDLQKQMLKKDTQFMTNIIRIIKNSIQRKKVKQSEQRNKSKFKSLAIGHQLDEFKMDQDDQELDRELDIEINQNNYRKQS